MSLPSTEDNVVSHAPDADPAWRGLIRGSAVIAIGLTFELGFQFARTIILARLLGATEFGLVASINVLIAIVDMATFIGTDRYLVFTPDGGRQHTLDVAHTLTVLRGLICSAATFLLAVPTASLLGAGDYWAGFAIISITPLIRSAAHLGVVQVQRSNCFWPSALTDSAAMLLGLLAAVIAAFVAPDHRAIIWGLCAQATGSVVFSHILARKQPYRFSFDREPMREALRFGLPLMGNGLALAAVYQLDRIIVGAWLGVAVLGLYGLGVTLMLQPITLLLRLSTTLLQPRLSRAWHSDRSGVFEVHVRALGRFSAILGGAGAVATACVGAPLLRLMFGASYTASDIFFVMMAGIVFVRFSRGAVNLLGLSIGQTSGLMVANAGGVVALPVTIAALYLYPVPASAVFGLFAGELVSFLVADNQFRRHHTTGGSVIIGSLVAASIVPLLSGIWVILADPALWLRGLVVAATLSVGALAGLRCIRTLRLPSQAATVLSNLG